MSRLCGVVSEKLVSELCGDSITVDPRDEQRGKVNFIPFTGISPTSSQYLFSMVDKRRKGNDGKPIRWNPAEAKPRLRISYSQWATETAETAALDQFEALQEEKEIPRGDTQRDV